MRKVFQITDHEGKPMGGWVIEAPDDVSLQDSMGHVLAQFPEGSTMGEVGSESDIVSADGTPQE